ncbi:hypothetical protein NDU88_005878 [Pleurodeles waltl]|uniref:Uncharacterized protein n=1 Tax=Pleurodeles waltl TaxID=8319 RepID=A0AAV7W917_PLEWA|nr:hypothetical protein NDU88_005878 [Pleurodeles waltl]
MLDMGAVRWGLGVRCLNPSDASSPRDTAQENSEGGRHKRERTATPLKDITMKLQNVRVASTVDSSAALDEQANISRLYVTYKLVAMNQLKSRHINIIGDMYVDSNYISTEYKDRAP